MNLDPDQSEHRGDITIFTTEDGQTRVAVRFHNENVWLTQKLMAELYECSTDNISLHLKNIYTEREQDPEATTEESSVVQMEGEREVTLVCSPEFDPCAMRESGAIAPHFSHS